MTVLAAAVDHDGTIHAASDLRSASDGLILDGAGAGKLAVLDFAGTPVLFGTAGLHGIGQLARLSVLREPPPTRGNPDDWAWAFADLLTRVMLDRQMTGGDGFVDMNGLLGWNGRLWALGHGSAARVDRGWHTCGSGRELAAGALHALYDDVDAEQAVRRAVDAAGLLDDCHQAGLQTFHLPRPDDRP